METVNRVELADPKRYPDADVLKGVLGRSFPAYEALLAMFSANGMVHEWRYYKDGKAWLCKVQKRKKTVVWMSAWKGYMQAAIYVPVTKIGEVLQLDISEALKERIGQTRDVGRSKPVIFEIRTKKSLDDLAVVIRFKEALK
jgi:hypothetical protein